VTDDVPANVPDALAERLAELSPAKRAYVVRALQKTRAAATASDIPRHADSVPAPLAFQQELLWQLERATGGSATYNRARALRIRGPLDGARLEAALNALVARHETLRTTIAERDGRPVQVVGPAHPVRIERVDLTHVPAEGREAALVETLCREGRVPFDLARDPLLRAVLVTVDRDDCALMLLSHHVASDGSTGDILFRELSALYDDPAASLPALPVRYVDFAAFQRAQLRGERLESDLAYWRAQLDGAPDVLELPTDRPRSGVPDFEGAQLDDVFPREVAASVVRVARDFGVTPFIVLLAAFSTLLHRYASSDDVVVGSVFSGRTRSELDGIVGYFSNTLPLRARFGDDPAFADVLARVRETYLSAAEHADVPFEALALDLRGATARAGSALFQVVFAMGEEGQGAPALRGADVQPIALDLGVARLDLTINAWLRDDGLKVWVEYRTSLFDASTIARMLRHLRTLLEGIAADPRRPVSSLPLLDAGEVAQFARWNATQTPYGSDTTIVDAMRAQALRTPEAIALECAGERATYAQTEERAARLGGYLRALGVGPGTLVAVVLERSVANVVAFHGVHRAGGAYVPIDPELPSERIAFMLEDCGAAVVLTHESLRASLPPTSARVVCIDAEREAIARAQPSAHRPSRSDLAYVIYTSGSTGRPKGVQVEHGNLMNLLAGMREIAMGEGDTLLALAPFSFDMSVADVFVPPSRGARMVIASRETAVNPSALAEVLASAQVTHLQATPTTWRMLLESGWRGGAGMTLICGGEALPQQLADRLASCGALWNFYGPTEATVWATCERLRAGEPVSVGRPMANVRTYVLDRAGARVPVGVPGELCIGGDGVARGYRNRPELNAERFVADPFAGVPDARMYRTGDVARFRADGRIEVLGRADFQVKVRGYRIELGEIEAALRACAGIDDAAAVVRTDDAEDARLVAYVAGAGAQDAAALREALRARLPAYMVPSAIVPLAALPLSANGKLDRAALPAPDAAPRALARAAYAVPRTPTEAAIVRLLCELFAADIGIDDDFFELGGYSLLAMRLLSRVGAEYGVQVPLRSFFDRPTAAALAAAVDARATSGVGAIARRHGAADAPLSFRQELLWLHDQLHADGEKAVYNVPVAVRVAGRVDVGTAQRALDALVERHAVLRARFIETGIGPVQLPSSHAVVLRAEDLSAVAADERERALRSVLHDNARAPFDLAAGPPFRALLVRVADDDCALLFVAHHIAFDGWSISILLREFAASYEAFAAGRAPALPELPIAYADFAAWERESFAGAPFEALAAHWHERLAGAPARLALPYDRPGAMATFKGDRRVAEISPRVVSALERLARDRGASIFAVLLSAYQTLLHRYTGQDDVVVGSPVAARSRSETSGLIGYLTHPVAYRARFAEGAAFVDVLAATRAWALDAIEHGAVPLERLFADDARRDGTAGVSFQAVFVLHDDAEPRALGDARMQRMPLDLDLTAFDLVLSVSRRDGALRAAFEYRTALFDAATIEQLLRHFVALLDAVAADPARPVARLPMLSDAERAETIARWNDTAADYPRERTIPQLVGEWAARTPDAIAVVADDGALTYAELDRRATLIACELHDAGVERGAFVGVCVDRTSAMAVALLGVLKAGAAYLPLDPASPAARLASMVADAGATVVVGEPALRDVVADVVRRAGADAPGVPRTAYVLPPPHASTPLDGATRALPHGDPEDVAYVIYTSGSTGRPKGVPLTHRGLANFLWSMGREPGITAADTMLAVAALSFDAATWEVWLPLVFGARLVIAPRAALVDGQRLGALIAESGTTLMQATPTMWRLLLGNGWRGDPAMTIASGGEALTAHLADELLPRVRALWNAYGPTEVTIAATVGRVEPNAPIGLGRALANTQLYVLEPSGEPAPYGVAGELYVGGDGVARGYINRPELTAERFVPDRFRPERAGAQLYRTGDRVRRHRDGRLEYLGRIDEQVKLRGFRIELGEIESALESHPLVDASVAVLYAPAPERAELVAYYVCGDPATDDDAVSPTALRAYLRERLPDYMLPSLFVRLPALPLTASGKVDRNALPAPDEASARARGAAFTAPRTAAEAVIAAAIAEVLGMPDAAMGIDDDFFEAGGNSLLAMRVVARLGTLLRTRISVRNFFENPTARRFAAAVAAGEPSSGRVETIARAVLAAQAIARNQRARPREALAETS